MEKQTKTPIPYEKRRSRSLNIQSGEKENKMRSSLKMTNSVEKKSLMKVTEANLPSNIQVHVRVRPLLPNELTTSSNKSLSIHNNKKIICGTDREFTFDYVFPENSSQNSIFENSVKSNLDKCLEGYNFSAFAYGQTAAGKTYTMGTNYSKTNDCEHGVIQLSIFHLFNKIKEQINKEESEFIIKASFIEIYNEEIRDLFNIKTPSKNIVLRDNITNNSVIISGVTEMPVIDADDALNLIWTGSLNRKTAATYFNVMSSRSHAIFSLYIEKINTSTKQAVNFKINFIDLAGSERLKKTGATGDRFKESVSINSGLLSLSKVIMALADESKKNSSNPTHIPYRDSKLTRILKDSLGGNSITLMLACVSPSVVNTEETINTLNYASFAKNIKIKPMLNAQTISNDNEEILEKLRKENEDLKKELDKCKSSVVEAENYKLKGIIKVLREKMKKVSINKHNPDIIIPKPQNDINDEQELKLIENISPEINDKDDQVLDPELNEICRAYSFKENANLELEYANKIKENIRLKEENENLSNEILMLREKEKDYMNKLDFAARMFGEEDEMSLEEYINDGKKQKVHSSMIRLSTQDRMELDQSQSESLETEFNQNNQSKESNVNKKKINSTSSHSKRNSISFIENSKISPSNPQYNLVQEKIKKLRDFQNALKNKILETEVFKNKLVKNKNDEITFVKRDMLEKTRQLKNLEKVNERNAELLEESENTISVLKEQLRNKSQEIKKIKQTITKPSNGFIPLPSQDGKVNKNKRTNSTSMVLVENSNVSMNISVITTEANNTRLKNNYLSGSTLNQNLNVTNLNSSVVQDEPKEFFMTLKMMMKKIEELILQKHKLEKKMKYLEKEKTEFLNMIKVNEERLQNKLKSLTKIRNNLEFILKTIDENNKEKISLSNKYQNTMSKVNSLNNRIERMGLIKENTLKEIQSNEEIIKTQIDNIENSINEFKNKISNNNKKENDIILGDEEMHPGMSRTGSGSNLFEMKNELKEKEEKLMFLQLDNMYKDQKILDMEKNMKDQILKYEDKIFQLQFEVKNLASQSQNMTNSFENQNLNNSIACLDDIETSRSEVNNLKIIKNKNENQGKKTDSKGFAKPVPVVKVKRDKPVLPPSIKNPEQKGLQIFKLESGINELTTPSPKETVRIPITQPQLHKSLNRSSTAKTLTKNRSYDNLTGTFEI